MKAFLKTATLLLMVLSLFSSTACGKDSEAKAKATTTPEVTGKLPKLLDLGAHKCIPCKKMAPILEELTKQYTGVFDVEFIDVWQPENKERAKAHKIKGIPTQIFLDADGRELWRHEGYISKEDILKKWKDLGFNFKPIQAK